jgi:hypothetical protein
MFLQPFVAVGDYGDIRRLAQPRSFQFVPAALAANPDFNTVFVVWPLSAADASRPGVFSPLRDLAGAFGADGTHVVMVKLNYWLGL